MFDIYDSETVIKIYRMLKKKCDAIDRFINNHAMYYGSNSLEYGAIDVCNNIIDLMTRKNQLINLKIIVDNAIRGLPENDKKILFIKMNYNITMTELCSILEIKERTAFRWCERAYLDLTDALNNSKYCQKLRNIIDEESWINSIREEVKERRMAFKFRVAEANV